MKDSTNTCPQNRFYSYKWALASICCKMYARKID